MKKHKLILVLFLALSTFSINSITSQTKYIDKSGTITFEASEELFEPVKATNESVTMILDVSTNQIASLALMKGFRFKNSLMEEHFNENYIESETYPKATFKGKLMDFNFSELSEATTTVTVEGTLQLHGQTKNIVSPMEIKKSGESISLEGSFSVTPADFDIEIPKIVQNKIAKEIQVSLNFNLEKK